MKKLEFGQRKFNSIWTASALELTVGALLSMTDSAIVGHIVGEDGLSAINGIMPLMTVSIFVGTVIASGSALAYSRAAGAFRKEEAYGTVGLSILLSAAAGLLLMLIGLLGIPAYLSRLGTTEHVRSLAGQYMTFFSVCLLISPLKDLMSSFVYSDGGEALGAAASIADSLGNVILSIPLGLKLGMNGIALGTLLSNLLSMLLLTVHFFRPRCSLRIRFAFSGSKIWFILKSGVNSDTLFLYLALLGILCNRIVLRRFGAAYLPMLTVLYAAIEIGVILEAAGEAIRPMVSAYFGEGNVSAIRSLMRYAGRSNVLLGLLLSVLLLVSAPWIPLLFDLGENMALCQSCVRGLRLYAISCVPMSWLALYDSYWLYIDRQKLSLLSNTLKYFLCAAVLSTLLSRLLGPDGLWLGFGLAPFMSLGILLLLGRSVYRNASFPLLMKDDGTVLDCSLELEPEAVVKASQTAESFLAARGVNPFVIRFAALNIEELLLLTKEKNPDTRVWGELCMRVEKQGVAFVLWDSGIPFDVTDTDAAVSSFRAYVVSNIMQNNETADHMLNVGFNRTKLYFRFEERHETKQKK